MTRKFHLGGNVEVTIRKTGGWDGMGAFRARAVLTLDGQKMTIGKFVGSDEAEMECIIRAWFDGFKNRSV